MLYLSFFFQDCNLITASNNSDQQRKETNNCFKCKSCNTGFERKNLLLNHIKAAHNKQKPVECQICNQKFGRKDNLLTHIKTVHEKQKKFECQICKVLFGKKSDLLK